MVSFVGTLKLRWRSRRMTRSRRVILVDVEEPGRRLPHEAQCRIRKHRLCHHLATCKYPLGRVTPCVHLHFTPCDFNTFIFTKHFYTLFLCRSMIDPARKPVEAQQAKPVMKPASTHYTPKRARLVLITFSCF